MIPNILKPNLNGSLCEFFSMFASNYLLRKAMDGNAQVCQEGHNNMFMHPSCSVGVNAWTFLECLQLRNFVIVFSSCMSRAENFATM